MDALLSYIAARTSLPLLDLRYPALFPLAHAGWRMDAQRQRKISGDNTFSAGSERWRMNCG